MPDAPSASDDASPPLSRGLAFGSGSAPRRRRRGLLVAFVCLAGIALVWPVYPLFGSIRPFVLGLPLSFAWVIGWLVAVFVAVAMLYRAEEVAPDPSSEA